MGLLGLAGCGAAPADGQVAQFAPGSAQEPAAEPAADKPELGLLTSLPLYWPLGADMESLAGGAFETPWQREVIERRYDIVPLDTLSPMPGLTGEAADIDPLEGLERLAVIQPRGLSPADNVALDDWVRGGGHLLLVLDPMLTSHFPLPLGDPRLPTIAATIPAVVKRWGLVVAFRGEHTHDVETVPFADDGSNAPIVLRSMAGEILPDDGASPDCDYRADRMIARCNIEKGQVTLVADAASFEYSLSELAPESEADAPILALTQFAFD
jgi:hypothetical protein